jgi:hypothetical protein
MMAWRACTERLASLFVYAVKTMIPTTPVRRRHSRAIAEAMSSTVWCNTKSARLLRLASRRQEPKHQRVPAQVRTGIINTATILVAAARTTWEFQLEPHQLTSRLQVAVRGPTPLHVTILIILECATKKRRLVFTIESSRPKVDPHGMRFYLSRPVLRHSNSKVRSFFSWRIITDLA